MKREVDVTNIWNIDCDNLKAYAVLIENDFEVANVVVYYDEPTLRYSIGNKNSEMNEEFCKKAFGKLIMDKFEYYVNLPKISKCSRLLQEIYDNILDSDSSMYYITEEDLKEQYIEEFIEEDINYLQKDIKKYNLDEVIGIDQGEYKIIGYGELETRFNDDRYLKKRIKTFNSTQEVWEEFSMCKNEEEIKKLIGDIPSKYGKFSYRIFDDDVNIYNELIEDDVLKKITINFDLETGFINYDEWTIVEPCKRLGEGWKWYQFDDESGYLSSPSGEKYMLYDLNTNEYQENINSDYQFFPLCYYYIDGEDPEKFDPFEYMEKEMIKIISKEELSL